MQVGSTVSEVVSSEGSMREKKRLVFDATLARSPGESWTISPHLAIDHGELQIIDVTIIGWQLEALIQKSKAHNRGRRSIVELPHS